MQGRRKPLTALAIAAALAAAPLHAQVQTPQLSPAGALQLLETYLESLRQQSGIPGMSAAVVRDGEVVWDRGFGYQNVASRVHATPDTPYLAGDLTGALASTLVLQCVEQRRLELDAPIKRYDLAQPDPEATVRQLLSHAAPQGAVETFIYNPDRYATLTAVMEWCAPQPYRKSVAHRILNRLAMTDSVPGTDLGDPRLELPETLFTADDLDGYRRVLERMALPYKLDSRKRPERTDVPSMPITASNGLVSTVRDLAKLDAALDTRLLLMDDTLAAAWTPAQDRDGAAMPMGLGWFVQNYRGVRLVWHFGYVANGYSSLWLKVPERNVTFILMANSDGLSAPFQLSAGDVTRSLFATVFLKLIL
jgi:CubicO group peptidase (beta-lactamase class C family)